MTRDASSVCSMTGFGRAEGTLAGRKVSVEVATVNHRNLEVSVHMPPRWSRYELDVRRAVGRFLSRGKVRVSVRAPDIGSADAIEYRYRPQVAEAYIEAFEALRERPGTEEEALTAREVVTARGVVAASGDLDEPTDASEREGLAALVDAALEGVVASRREEGEALREDLRGRCEALRDLLEHLEERLPAIREELRKRYRARFEEVLSGCQVPEERLLTELVLSLERTEVHEEMVRLRAHVDALAELLVEGGRSGRRMAFLGQEMNREANTIGSKAADPRASELVVRLKDEVAKVREQVENLE